MQRPRGLLISGGTIIDGVTSKPLEGCSIWVEDGRIGAIPRSKVMHDLENVEIVDATSKFIVPGLMNANVHLFAALSIERLARHAGHYDDIIVESAQIALKNGLTTVFDTWGPRASLLKARDQIADGLVVGSRFFCAGNIVGLDGPFSRDFFSKAAEIVSPSFARRINAIWVENVGRHLMWLTPELVARHVREYTQKRIDFLKYASNEHYAASAGAFLAFSPHVQAAIVDEAHRAGITAQAHTESVEGLRIAVEAGCDLIQHANLTGPIPIPQTTLALMAERRTGAVVFPFTQQRLEFVTKNETRGPSLWLTADSNVHHLMEADVPLLLANDGAIFPPEVAMDPANAKSWALGPGEDNLADLATGHFAWLKAMEEKGMPPMQLLQAATRNIAVAYGKESDLGTLEFGKIADILILNKDPLLAAENYRSIHLVIKDGAVVDRTRLPGNPILTLPLDLPADEESSYIPFLESSSAFPTCPVCLQK